MTRPTPGDGRRRGRRVRCNGCGELRYGPLIRGLCAECEEQRQASDREFRSLIDETIPDAAPALQCRYCRAAVTWLNDNGFCSNSCMSRFAERVMQQDRQRQEREQMTTTNNYGVFIDAPTHAVFFDAAAGEDENTTFTVEFPRPEPPMPMPLRQQVEGWWNEPTEELIEQTEALAPLTLPQEVPPETVERLRQGWNEANRRVIEGRGVYSRDSDQPITGDRYVREVYQVHGQTDPIEVQTDHPMPEPPPVRGEPDHDLDLGACLAFNASDLGLDATEITRVLANISGQWGGENYHWLLEVGQGNYCYLVGWCSVNGWEDDSLAQAWFAMSPYEALTRDDSLSEDIVRRLMGQILGNFIEGVRSRINQSIEKESEKRHVVKLNRNWQGRRYYTWQCQNCDFVSTNADEARKHSELRRTIDPPPGWIRKPRRDL